MSEERLTCKIDDRLKVAMTAYGQKKYKAKKGKLSKVYRELLGLAFATPDAPRRVFPEERQESITLDASETMIEKLDAYQDMHQIGERRQGFKSALLLGWSIHLDAGMPPVPSPGPDDNEPQT